MPDVQSILNERFRAAMAKALGDAAAGADPAIRPSANPTFGDFQANAAMALGKKLGQKPRDVAQKIVAALDVAGICDKVEIAGPGFVNLHLNAGFLAGAVAAVAADARLGVPVASPALRVALDYSGPNVAKEMHVGHLRSSVIGDAIGRVLEFQGHTVIRQNHMGDWGTQFGMLIQNLMESAGQAGQPESMSIGDLNAFYQASKKRFDEDAEFATRARQRVVALQSGDERTLRLWGVFIEQSKRHFNEVYKRLRVRLTDDDIRAESFYNPMLAETVAELESKGLARESQGALCVFPEGYKNADGDPLPLIIRKSDGGFLYATTDLAAVRYRARDLKADRMVYVTDARQRQHFAMVFKAAAEAGWLARPQGAVSAEHVPFGTVLGEDNKPFKTRSGEVVKLTNLLDEADERAAAVLASKNPDLPAEQRKHVAEVVAIGALKYADLSNDRIKDYVFNWDRMLSFDGNTAPYLQYAFVRIRSIFRKAQAQGLIDAKASSSPSVAEPAERALALKILQFPGVVEGVGQSLEPHRMTTYLYEVASRFHDFFEHCPVLQAPDAPTRAARLALCDLVARVLKQGLELLGIEVVEQM
ncbi:MAG: arginine--tRNA ligase [Planctomycetota bacterium]|nr:arginine--tRNA ligase [Planctomycetota bacterium]